MISTILCNTIKNQNPHVLPLNSECVSLLLTFQTKFSIIFNKKKKQQDKMKKMFSTSSLFRSKGVKEPTITEYYTLDVDDETTYKRIDQKKTILSNLYCRIMIGLSITCCLLSFGFLVLFLITWFSVADYLWNVVFSVNPAVNCGLPYRLNTPSNYTIQTKCPYFEEPTSQWHDKLKKYFVDQGNYETVSFMSRDADWIEGGIGMFSIFFLWKI